ncbi:putative ribosome biogenesis GTPase RsgA [Clostridium sp. CAG:411]|jgi:ribosome biogenesis GTPase|nr:ribosome small subunit-dependent GTPase A [Lachnospiraceae bacterium]CDE44084.1 putative ribosome biogenesis GTPase RsgA [Clostridium sp. CAG:411]
MNGKIIKGIAGFYYIHTGEQGVFECKAKGAFRNKKMKPLVGDNVEITVLDSEKKIGNVISVEKRKNQLIRPAVANVDQAIVIFSCAKPQPNLNLLDRFLVSMEQYNVETIICFNKCDLVTEEEMERLKSIYESSYQVLFTSVKDSVGIELLKEQLKGKTSVLAGPSGVGKSSTINCIIPEANMETGQISQKIERGKHTTRHSELFRLAKDTYIMDTPGFTSLYVTDMEKEQLRFYFPEFSEYEGKCRFQGCVHVHEPSCKVKEAVETGKLSKERYENYQNFYGEIKDKKKTYK